MSAYVDGLKMLARRELSETQVRQRLARKGYDAGAVDDAIDRLKGERAIDDARVAAAIARTETTVKKRGRARVTRQIESAGIASAIARAAVEDAFGGVDGDALLEASLERRLRGGRAIADAREFHRLFRYLAAQGFETAAIFRVLRARSVK